MTPTDSFERMRRAVQGTAVGDAFGLQLSFCSREEIRQRRQSGLIPGPPHGSSIGTPWPFTDDTLMALSIVENLRRFGQIEQDALAQSFAAHFDERRGYGMAMFGYMERILRGEEWGVVAGSLFDGQGSFGNGSAMRIAPLGAFFADRLPDDRAVLIDNAHRSAAVTHAHPEAAAGAIAVALAAGWAEAQRMGIVETLVGSAFVSRLVDDVPTSTTQAGIVRAIEISSDTPIATVAGILGNGSRISAMDTVPLVVWCAAHHLDDFSAALWTTAEALGDVDTTCAMVGGIVAANAGSGAIPSEWLARTEALPEWPFADGR